MNRLHWGIEIQTWVSFFSSTGKDSLTMRLTSFSPRRSLLFVGFMVILGCAVSWAAVDSPQAEFSRSTIDVGIVVSDAQKSVDFYTKAIGFTDAGGFDVPGGLAKDSGLSDNHPFHVHVMVLDKESSATKIKLMQFNDAPGKKTDQSYISSSLGLSYLTIWVSDIDAAVARAGKHGVKPLAKGPVPIPGDMYLACINDPDGNIIELVGPKK